jgi:hypothetical protein
MTEAPAPPFRKRRPTRRPAARPSRASPRSAWAPESLHRVDVVAPDPECASLLLEYASPLFPAELVSGPELLVRLQPPIGAGWVIEPLSLVERWLDSARLPCAKVLYGGRSYLVRSSTHVAQLAAAEPATAPTR